MVRQRLLLHNVVKNICRFLAVRMFFAICISIILTPVISIRARTRIELNRLHGYKSVFAVAGLGAVIALSLAITLLTPVTANAAADDTVNFQARLESNTGAIVPDGNYNIEFKLYDAASGGAAEWTEDYTYNSGPSSADERVQVIDGYLSVALGSVTSFPSTINWNQTQYLTMNIGGTGTTGSYPTMGDGEMDPRIQMTAVPYAFQAGELSQFNGSTNSTLGFATQTAANTLLLPNESGTLCSTGRVCAGYAPASGSSNYIQNGSSPQSGTNYDISGTGVVGTSLSTPLVDSPTGSTLTLQSSSGGIDLNPNGSSNSGVLVSSATNSTAAFQIQNSSNITVLNVDTTKSTTTIRAGTDTAQLGSELNTTTDFTDVAWTSTGWTTTSTTATNDSGNTTALSTNQFSLSSGATYQVSYQLSGTPTVGSTLTVDLGSVPVEIYTFTGNPSEDDFTDTHLATYSGGGAALSFNPSSDFTGTISNVSLKLVTPNNAPALVIDNASGTANVEIRASNSTTNTFAGLGDGQSNISGVDDTSLGSQALESNTTGSDNSALGDQALAANTVGSQNSVLGSQALMSNTSGSDNTALGYQALSSNLTGSQDTALGDDADVSNGNLTNATAIGFGAVVSDSNTVVIGNTGVSCVIIGASSCSSHSGEELGVNGIGVASGGFYTGTPDVAEYIDASAGTVADDVVVADPNNAEAVTTSSIPYDTSAVGVVTNGTSGFQMLNPHYGQAFNGLNGESDPNAVPMAVTGRVPVNVTGEGGNIVPGDYITTSSTAGYGMKADQAGAVIGKALGYFDGSSSSDKGTVLVLIDLSYYAGPAESSMVQNNQSASLTGLSVTGDTQLNNLNTSGTTSINNLTAQTATVTGNLLINGTAQFSGDIVIGGHIITAGTQPTIAVQAAAGQPTQNNLSEQISSATITGNDTTGTITITTSSNPTGSDLANVTFSKAFTGNPHIIITGQDAASTAALVYPSGVSLTGFNISMVNNPAPNTTYTFDYIIAQ
jgi:hypothetical protein